jgi:hypothetical protein
MYLNSQSFVKERLSLLLSTKGSIDVGFMSENHQKNQPYCKWGSSIKSRCYPPFVSHFLHLLVEQIDPQLAILNGPSWCYFLHLSYTAIMNGQSGVILYVMPHMIDRF